MQTEAVIYLADQRGCTQTPSHCSYHTFNFGTYQRDYRKPFSRLTAFNEELLAPTAQVTYTMAPGQALLVLPTEGSVAYETNGTQAWVEVGHCVTLFTTPGIVTLSNTHLHERNRFICACFRVPALDNATTALTGHFNHDAVGRLQCIAETAAFCCYTGRFAGRSGEALMLREASNVFVHVLHGAFEVEDRLLIQHDGLHLANVSHIEFESLSVDARLLVVVMA